MTGNRHRPLLAWSLLPGLLPFLACRSSGDFRIRVLPDPVPVCRETGMAHYQVEVLSLAALSYRLGKGGPLLEPRSRILLERDLPSGEREDRIGLFHPAGAPAGSLRFEVPKVPSEEDHGFPLPDLGGHEVRITAGFHAPGHRRPGRRRALDLVPLVPGGGSILGCEVRSRIEARVLALTKDEADRPGGIPNEIVLEDLQGRVWRLSHFARDSIPLHPGQRVRRGDLLGRIGLSGRTNGPHLHMERVR